MKNVALVTYRESPKLIDGDNLLVEPFNKHGLEVKAVPWDQPNIDWQSFDLVILRSCWNYHYKVKEFADWLNSLEKNKVNLWNPINIVKWNINKKYLLDLKDKGIPIITTSIFNQDNIDTAQNYINSLVCKEIVIKPTSGASAYKVNKIRKTDYSSDLPIVKEILSDSEAMIQPYMKEISDEGEYSFIFFNKKYSHAVLKHPKKEEYRTQLTFGGREEKTTPDDSLIKQAQNVLFKIDSPLLYARVDGICVNGKLLLMELELTEPYLFFEYDEKAAQKFTEAVESIFQNTENLNVFRTFLK